MPKPICKTSLMGNVPEPALTKWGGCDNLGATDGIDALECKRNQDGRVRER